MRSAERDCVTDDRTTAAYNVFAVIQFLLMIVSHFARALHIWYRELRARTHTHSSAHLCADGSHGSHTRTTRILLEYRNGKRLRLRLTNDYFVFLTNLLFTICFPVSPSSPLIFIFFDRRRIYGSIEVSCFRFGHVQLIEKRLVNRW